MKVFLADKAGFCFGVKRAISTAFKAAAGGNVYCLGPLIHNPQEVERLRQAGVKTVEDFTSLKPGDFLIIRSLGVPPRDATPRRACQTGGAAPQRALGTRSRPRYLPNQK